MVAGGYVSVKKHPTAALWIHNYTAKAQYERVWNETTLQCRGLILGPDGEVVARPFRKFFNLGEHQGEIPAEPFNVYEKLDGSLGILYWLNGEPCIATRGSFTSEQAVRATRIVRERYDIPAQMLARHYTYLFEIILPENRIVVDYGDREDVVLLTTIRTADGEETPNWDGLKIFGFPVVQHYGIETDPHSLLARETPNAEGFVIHWPTTGLRLKVKFAEYLRLHRIITGVTPRHIWEHLRTSSGSEVTALFERVPDEFAEWAQGQIAGLLEGFCAIEADARAAFVDLGDRRANAERYKKFAYPQILFAMLDGKPYADMIWKLLYPPAAKPFKVDEP